MLHLRIVDSPIAPQLSLSNAHMAETSARRTSGFSDKLKRSPRETGNCGNFIRLPADHSGNLPERTTFQALQEYFRLADDDLNPSTE
jgi:hypothetical protein